MNLRVQGFRKIATAQCLYLLGVVLVWLAFAVNSHDSLHNLDYLWFRSSDMAEGLAGTFDRLHLSAHGCIFLSALCSLLLGYLMLYRSVAGLADSDHTARRITICLVVFNALLFSLLPPFLSYDFFSYFQQGWILAVKHLSPYVYPPAEFADLPLQEVFQTRSETLVSPYGPIWTYLSALVVLISGNEAIIGIVLFKGIALAAYLLLFYTCLRMIDGDRYPTFILVFLNPLFLLEGPGMAHNDIFALMLSGIGVAICCSRRSLFWLGLIVIFMGAMTKAFAALAIVLVLLHFAMQGDIKARHWMATVTALALGVVSFFLLSRVLVDDPTQYSRMLGFGSIGGREISMTPAVVMRDLILFIAQKAGIDVRGEAVTRGVFTTFYIAGGIVIAGMVLRYRSKRSLLPLMAPSYAVATVVLPYWRQWYALWPLGLSIFYTDRIQVRLIVLYSILAAASYLITHSGGVYLFS